MTTELRQLAPSIYAYLQEDRGFGYSNSGLIDRGGGLVVDTLWDLPHTRAMMDSYASVSAAPAARVVNTHANGDHCWGNQLYAACGAEIIGHRHCAEEMERDSPTRMQFARSAGDDPSASPGLRYLASLLVDWDFDGIELVSPTTIVDDHLDLVLDETRVSLEYVGPAHTAGDVIVHLPDEGIVFTGDVLFRQCTPIGWEGTTAKWCEALDRIVALEPEVIVPGHGPLCGIEGPTEMKAYLQYVFDEAREGFARERTVLETAKSIDLGPYASWTEPQRVVMVVARAYRELRGEPWDAPLGRDLFDDVYALVQHWSATSHPS